MELIDRYIYAVGRRLPQRQRADIEKELRSLIMDELEARTGEEAPSDQDVIAVLKKIGPPQRVAAQYSGRPQHLIGPELFPLYRLVAAIVFAAMSMGLVIACIVNLLSGGENPLLQLLALLGQIVTGAASAFGFVTLAFAILERVIARGQMESFWKEVKGDEDIQKAKEWFDTMGWDPEKLRPVPLKEDIVKPAELVFDIAFTIIALVLFNHFSNQLVVCSGGGSCVPIFSQEALRVYLPLWNAAWVLSIGKSCLLLVRGRWETGTHIYDIVLSVLHIVILGMMLTGPFIISQGMLAWFEDLHVPFVAGMLHIGLLMALAIALVVTAVKAVVKTVRVIRGRV